MGSHSHEMPCMHMAAAFAGYRMPEPLVTLLAQTAIESTPLPLQRTISGSVGRRSVCGQRVLTIESLLMSRCGQSHEPPENSSRKF